MSYVGSWKIDDLLTFVANTQVLSTGVATDADSPPTYRVYEDETTTPILTGSMALLDSSNTAGFYSEQITLSAANGFEKGKAYSIYIAATVSSVTGTTWRAFQIQAEVAAASVNANAITATSIAADAITDATVASDVTIASVTGSVGSVASGGITAASFAANAITAAKLDPDVTTELQAGLATSTSLTTLAGYVDTEVAAIKAKTDSLTFTVAGQVDANIQAVNDVTVTGTGSPGDEWGP